MGNPTDAAALALLKQTLAGLPAESPTDRLLRQARELPAFWRGLSIAEQVFWLRDCFGMTQRQVARLSGLPHSKVAKIEKGQDVRLSTLRQLFAGLGCGVVLVPLSPLTAHRLWLRAFALADEGYMPKRRRYRRR